MSGTLTFAFVAGTVATVNPCGFALLPAYLARRLGSDRGDRSAWEALRRGLLVGAVTTGGFLLVFGTFGTAIAVGARTLTRVLPWAGLAIGIALALAGLTVLLGVHIGVRVPDARARFGGGGLRGDLLFGIGYGTASLSCTLPVFLAVIGTAVTGGLAESAASFVGYALGMGTILIALALGAALSRAGLARALRRILPYINRASAALLLAAGLYVIYYWGFFLLPSSESRGGSDVIERGGQLSARFSSWLGSGAGQTVVAVLATAIMALVLWVLLRHLLGARDRPGTPTAERRLPLPALAERERRGR